MWRPALQLHKVIQWVQSLFHWRKSTGSGPSSHLSSARVRTHPLQLLISTLKFGLWCMAPVWEERETDAATCPALLIASLLFSWSSSTFQLRQVRFHHFSLSFFGRPPASLYLERSVNTITSVPRPFKKNNISALCSPRLAADLFRQWAPPVYRCRWIISPCTIQKTLLLLQRLSQCLGAH